MPRPSFGNLHGLLDLGTFSAMVEKNPSRMAELRAELERTKYFKAEASKISLTALLAQTALLSRAMEHFMRTSAGQPPLDPDECGCVFCPKPKTAWQWILDPAV